MLDTACARLALGQNATPPAIEDATRQIDDCAVQTRVLEREAALGADHGERLAAIAETARPQRKRGWPNCKARWEKERDLVEQDPRAARQAGSRIGRAAARRQPARRRPRRRPARRSRMRCARNWPQLNAELEQLQGETPLMRVCVDAQIVGEVISGWTGIPVGKMLKDEIADGARRWKRTWARA